MKIKTLDGNEASSNTSYLFTELAGIYPITPSSPMAENIDKWSKEKTNIFNEPVKVVEMQSEAGAAGFIHGSLQSGCLTSTYTSSQGLLLMIPNMYKMAGEMLPCVMHVAARSLSTHALSIMGDHQDIYAVRSTGFCMLASSSVQDAALLSSVAHLSSIKASLPFVHFFDGFRTSHEINKVKVLEKDDFKDIIPYKEIKKFRSRALNPMKPHVMGTNQGDDIYFQQTESRNIYYNKVADIVNNYMLKINHKAKTHYKPFNYYGNKEASNIIVAMGSVCETIKETIDYLNKNGYKVGLIEVHLFRPFSFKYFKEVLPDTVKRIAVLDRTKEPASREPLYLDVCEVLKNTKIKIVGGRYGLSSKDTTPGQIKAVYDMLNNKLKDDFTIGINDDVTNLSLPYEDLKISKAKEILIYGYGSDGMVSASKGIIKMIGNETNNYVQGYFEYDSKKSGGMTISHLRINNSVIKSTYYVNNPFLVVVSLDSYLKLVNPLKNIKKNGIFLLNTIKTEEEINDYLTNEEKQIINERKIKVYKINASLLANKFGLNNKISMIMESVILKLLDVIEYKKVLTLMNEFINTKYFKHGKKIITSNLCAIKESINYLEEVKIDENYKIEKIHEIKNNYEAIRQKKGNDLPVSAFKNYPDGHFLANTSSKDKRSIALFVPNWLNNNCLMCNQCSITCPHGVIRPFLLSEEEYNKAPEMIKARVKKDIKGYYYCLAFSVLDCTGCGLCIKACPSKERALKPISLDKALLEQEIYDYLEKNVTVKDIYNNKTVKGLGFKKPKFQFSAACSGCGEAAYLKVLTQLFGDNLIISNATGCSSIYGASMPSIPYDIPWASSLFEDNAEYGFGMTIANEVIRARLKKLMQKEKDPLCKKWLANMDDYAITKEVYDKLDYNKVNNEIVLLKDYLVNKNIWTVGGDGWAYDIGFAGIDHVLSSNSKARILVLDTEVYSNTGGQASKSTPLGSVVSFSAMGKKTAKKNLAKYAINIPNVYVGTINLSFNANQAIKTLIEANFHDGPSIVIAYCPCITHGINDGLINAIDVGSLATKCGYFPLIRYDGNKLTLDSKNVDFDLYQDFLNCQSRYSILKQVNKEEANYLLEANKKEAYDLYKYYEKMEND